jgi:hypothetical protein
MVSSAVRVALDVPITISMPNYSLEKTSISGSSNTYFMTGCLLRCCAKVGDKKCRKTFWCKFFDTNREVFENSESIV